MAILRPTKNEQRWFGFRGKWLTFWITVACATDMALFGYDQGVFSGVVISDYYLTVHGLHGNEKTGLLSIITSIYAAGCFVGAVLAFSVGEWLGRKRSILLGSAIMSIGAVLQTSSFSVPHMLVGRVVSGMGNGINTATAPVWQTETSPTQWRGKLMALEMMMNIFGFMLVNWINYGLSFVGGALAWRLPLALQFVFLVILFATVPWLPESPRWLLAHARADEATLILADLEDRAPSDPRVVAARDEILFSVRYERENAVRWRDLARGRGDGGTKTMRRLLLGMGSQTMQQFGGINIMSYYLPTLLIESVGLPDSTARLIAASSSVLYMVASGVAAPLVERYGRRTMMMVSSGIQLLCFLLLTILLALAARPAGDARERATTTRAAAAAVVFFFVYYAGFGLGMLGIPWLYPTEINSLPMRTKGAAAAAMANWLTNFAVVEVTPVGLRTLGWRFYIVWTLTNAAFVPLLWLLYPETAHRTLEDLDAYYRERPPLIVVRDPDAISRRRPRKFVEMQERDIREAAQRGNKAAGTREG